LLRYLKKIFYNSVAELRNHIKEEKVILLKVITISQVLGLM